MAFTRRTFISIISVAAICAVTVTALTASRATSTPGGDRTRLHLAGRTLDGSGNNLRNASWGRAGTLYSRVAAPNYADGIGSPVAGPPERFLSNRVFNDTGQNLFSENGVSQWGWVWGQFLDHDLDLRDETPGEDAPLAFNQADPLEAFTNDLGPMGFNRTPAAPGTGTGTRSPRQQVNTISSYIDASNVYGGTASRLDWLRAGSVDGDPTNNQAGLFLPDGFLPRADARGSAASAPPMDLMGPLMGSPATARVAGDVRANENIGLTATQTLLAREHNRIVAALPASLSAEERFQIARRVVGAEVQYITYTEFLPSLGVTLPRYRGYDPTVDASVSNEFATVGYRAHSQVHGEFDVDFEPGDFTTGELGRFRMRGIKVVDTAGEHALVIPLTVAFGNPDLLQSVGLDRVLAALSGERQYKNDEQIDNTMRSVLFQVPRPDTADPSVCGTPVVDPRCFTGVQDLGAIDVARGRDHGMPSYNDLRRAYGLSPRRSFAAITGESTSAFPTDRVVSRTRPIDDPDILDFVELRDRDGQVLTPGSDETAEEAVTGRRRTTLAARLRAIYGSVDRVDAFVGMIAEPHLPGSDLGPLQAAIWRRQFRALRDGDRYFYRTDPELPRIQAAYGISYRHTLADLIRLNAGTTVQPDVFTVVFAAGN